MYLNSQINKVQKQMDYAIFVFYIFKTIKLILMLMAKIILGTFILIFGVKGGLAVRDIYDDISNHVMGYFLSIGTTIISFFATPIHDILLQTGLNGIHFDGETINAIVNANIEGVIRGFWSVLSGTATGYIVYRINKWKKNK